jgi:hypothetical protein
METSHLLSERRYKAFIGFPLIWFSQASSTQRSSSVYYLLHTGFLLALFFNPEDGGNMFL